MDTQLIQRPTWGFSRAAVSQAGASGSRETESSANVAAVHVENLPSLVHFNRARQELELAAGTVQNLNYKGFPKLCCATEVAQIHSISPKTVHKLVRSGKLGCVQVTSRDRRFTQEQIEEYIRSQSTSVRVDKKESRHVLSRPKKGGDREQSVGVNGKDLREEMRRWR
jgi:hypothetical protein